MTDERTDAYWCAPCWERHELPPPRNKRSSPPCPDCQTKLRRCSRFEPNYSGPGGGYTRDYDKTWEVGRQQFHKRGIDHTIVLNDDCRKKGDAVYATAGSIAKWLDSMADSYA